MNPTRPKRTAFRLQSEASNHSTSHTTFWFQLVLLFKVRVNKVREISSIREYFSQIVKYLSVLKKLVQLGCKFLSNNKSASVTCLMKLSYYEAAFFIISNLFKIFKENRSLTFFPFRKIIYHRYYVLWLFMNQ